LSTWPQKDVKELAAALLNQLRLNKIFLWLGIEIEFYLRKEGRAPDDEVITRFSALFPEILLEKERGNGQYEFAMPYKEAEKAISALIKLKKRMLIAAKECALELILEPKPFADDYGSAMHLHLSLHDADGDNLFSENNDLMDGIIASVLDLVRTDLDFICNEGDLIRLQPGWMAPSHIAWGGNNRSMVIRVPHDSPAHRRFEFRLPSANSNPYKVLLFLLVGVLLSKGQKAIHTKIYGNAHDPQYNLPKLEFCNNILLKRFQDLSSLQKVLNDVKIQKLVESNFDDWSE